MKIKPLKITSMTVREFEKLTMAEFQAKLPISIVEKGQLYVTVHLEIDNISKFMGTSGSLWISGEQGANPSAHAMAIFERVHQYKEALFKAYEATHNI
ncbi:MAG: hypothetical protein AABY22_29595 [Nanoarchaeota archaeon]